MYINTNSIPEDYDVQKWLENYKAIAVNNPFSVSSLVDAASTRITTLEPLEDRLIEMEKQMELVKIDLKLSRLKILSLEGKFTQDEVANIRKMILSEDEGSRVLADSIMENA